MGIAGKARFLALAATLLVTAGCFGTDLKEKHLRPLSQATKAELQAKDMRKEDPILVRIFKEEDELEIWKPRSDGRYAHFRTYEICAWSGELGPKHAEGDRQAPEGFYTVTPAQMNPNSSYHLAFNIGFPNTFDRAHDRTGSHLMVHGDCSSAGCYAMTDEVIEEIYALARESFRGGQREFQVQAFPFRMTPENMARHADNPNMPFWRNLKEGSDHFEVTGRPPEVDVCGREYVFNARSADPARALKPTSACPPLHVPEDVESAVAAKQMRDETAFQVALAELRGGGRDAPDMTPAGTRVAFGGIFEEGSTDQGYEAPASDTAESETASAPTTSEAPPEAAGAQVRSALTGTWNRIMSLTRIPRMPQGSVMDGEHDAAPEDLLGQATDRGTLQPASAYAPEWYERDAFSVFGLFESVDGASVPADTVRR